MSELFAPVCSIAPTRRRRFLWAAWWTAPPEREPFRKPDAYRGGARSREEAFADAERAAGVRLLEIEPRWARAWARVLVEQPPWARNAGAPPRIGAKRERPAAESRGAADRSGPSIWSILGVSAKATEQELKQAFRKRALETHPDRGGEGEAFHRVQQAYEEAVRRAGRPRKRR